MPGPRHVVLGISALLGFGVQTLLLDGRLEWLDAYVGSAARSLQTSEAARALVAVTHAAPFVGAALVVAGIVLALRRGEDAWRIAAILVQLAVGLVLAWALKAVFHRVRPAALPWNVVGDSFPSGHVMNAALCFGTAWRLAPPRDPHGSVGPLRAALAVGGCVYVLAVAVTRVVLARHWLTDVTASLLLGTAWVALAPAPRPAVTRRLLLATPAILMAICVSAATGSRIALPSPSRLDGAKPDGLPQNHDSLFAVEIDDDGLIPPTAGATEYTLLAPTLGKQWVEVRNGRSAVLKLVARTHLDGVAMAANRLELLIDGTPVGVQPLRADWRTLAFALPTLEPGTHQFELLPRAPTFALGRPTQAAPPRWSSSAR
ncbi:MAG TPA: phosphatase PAP2 family protein [Candidatus Eisenbacteria bacterium]|nr:phosphatase PAP2 family protein [Candidatus Eisenbacteria bacterium]